MLYVKAPTGTHHDHPFALNADQRGSSREEMTGAGHAEVTADDHPETRSAEMGAAAGRL